MGHDGIRAGAGGCPEKSDHSDGVPFLVPFLGNQKDPKSRSIYLKSISTYVY
jgi:hypothetical protein